MIHGSSIPLDDGGFVVTVVCPNKFSYQRLIQALNTIVPEAGEPTPQPRRQPEGLDVAIAELIRRSEQDDDDTLGLKAGEAYKADES